MKVAFIKVPLDGFNRMVYPSLKPPLKVLSLPIAEVTPGKFGDVVPPAIYNAPAEKSIEFPDSIPFPPK